jgi:hypothetical protein
MSAHGTFGMEKAWSSFVEHSLGIDGGDQVSFVQGPVSWSSLDHQQ